MSTNRKESSNAAQTLFRLTSLRNPQLTETSNENLGFIFRPENRGVYGFFDDAVSNWNPSLKISKIKMLENSAANFIVSRDLKTEKVIDSGKFRNLRKLGKALSRNEKVLNELFNEAESEWNNLKETENEFDLYKDLWDHFIYQVVTQNDFYVKEALSQILKAIHSIYINTITSNTDEFRNDDSRFIERAAKAVIVLPNVLFQDQENSRIEELKSLSRQDINKLEHISEKEMKVSVTMLKKQRLELLKKELEIVQKNYQSEYIKAYNEAYENYKNTILFPLTEAYENQIASIEADFTDQTTDTEKEAAYKTVSYPDIPPFSFLYREEIDINDLSRDLSSESFETLTELTHVQGSLMQDDDMEQESPGRSEGEGLRINSNQDANLSMIRQNYNTYQKILDKAGEEISALYSYIVSLSELNQQKFTSLAGVLVPVKNQIQISPLAYYLRSHSEASLFYRQSFLQFGFYVEDDTWSVSSVDFTANTDKGRLTEKVGSIQVINGKISIPFIFKNKFETISSLSLDILFENGCTCVLEYNDIEANTNYSGLLNMRLPGNGNTGVTVAIPSSFQPKHFGVKRLGIADYLKVEQSVHAYVPGEVSNIENVMASELRHKSSTAREYSEITETTSKSQETEKLSDTTKTSRTDMQTEIARELDSQRNYEAHTRFGKSGTWYFEMGGSYANSTAQHDSNRQAVAKSQEITERALERVLSKISEERVQKIIKEYTETNVHEFDNRGKVTETDSPDAARPQHITGVYRWVDKKMKNQIYNYGKRTMFEFMIPEPARLHALATKAVKTQFEEPVDPRTSQSNTMVNANVDESILKYWADYYSIELTKLPEKNIIVNNPDIVESPRTNTQTPAYNRTFSIPQNYFGKSMTVFINCTREYPFYSAAIAFGFPGGNHSEQFYDKINTSKDFSNLDLQNDYLFGFGGFNIKDIWLKAVVSCELSNEFILSWKKEQFNKIIEAYNKAKEKFDADVKAANDAAAEQEKENLEKKTNFYRDTESNILKHNCIAYLLQSYATLGQEMSTDDGQRMQSFKMLFGNNLDNYTALAKFMEQAFEWSVMDYTFYPYYWASKGHWQDLYLSEDTDPLFRSFLQAGMARVIVTVKPGFENAVQFFMTTGKIWNGGEVPVVGDPLYLSIVDELRQPTGEPQGKYWITRIPTTLTILQDKSTGLPVEQPLPIFPESDPDNCENPLELETATSFEPRDIVLAGGKDTTTLPKELTTIINKK